MRILTVTKLAVVQVILFLSRCYSYLSVSTGAKLAPENYEGYIYIPYYPEINPQICIPNATVIITKTGKTEQPHRNEQTIAIRNDGNGRISENGERKS